MNIIEAQGILFSYERNRSVFHHPFSFSIKEGKMTTLLGPNGCGKTTLLKLMGRLLTPQQGEIFLEGDPLFSFDLKKLAQKISYVPQEIHPIFSISVIDFVLMGRAPYLKGLSFPKRSDYEIAQNCLREVGLFHERERSLQTLSAGEKQRALLAKALAQSTPILLLDEPTSHLDLKYQIETLTLLRSFQKKRALTCVIVLHDFHLASEWSEEIILLGRSEGGGTIVAQGTPQETLTEKNIFDAFEVSIKNPQAQRVRLS